MDGTITIYKPDGTELYTVTYDTDSYRRRQVMGEHAVTLKFQYAGFVDIPVGSYVEFREQRYTLYNPSDFQKDGTRKYGYTLKLEAPQAAMADTILINRPDGRTSFSCTARPKEFLETLVWNLNERPTEGLGSEWTIGSHLEAQPVTLSFNETTCTEALRMMAEAFHTEWEVGGANGKEISLRKVEYFKDAPLALQYGKGNGFKPGVGRGNFDNNRPVHRLFVRGGERNIDFSTYHSQTLLLPEGETISYDGTLFSDQGELNPELTRTYRVNEDRRSLERTDADPNSRREASLDLTNIYPMREGTVTAVEATEVTNEDGSTGFVYDFFDNTIPEALDYSQCRMDGEKMTVVFQTGMLAGREFDLEQTEGVVTGYVHTDPDGDPSKNRRFKLVSQMIDGFSMPGGNFVPRVGEKYAVFGIKMPDQYIRDNEWNLFREAVRYKYENEEQRFTFKGELDPIYAQEHWLKIGGKLVPGGYVSFSDPQFQPDGMLIRISAIKEYLHQPYKPQLELSNVVIGGGVRSEIARIDQAEVVVDDRFKETLSYTKRRFRDAEEHLGLVEQAVKGYDKGINPVWIKTMAGLFGDDTLQFRFLRSRTDHTVVEPVVYDEAAKTLSVENPCVLQHMTLGTKTLGPKHDESEYRNWDMEPYTSPVIDDTVGALYFYAKCSKAGSTGEFLYSPDPMEFDNEDGHYYMLVGTLSSESNGERSYVSCYGFTEILPGRITVGKIVDESGEQYWDMQSKEFRIGDADNNLSFSDGTLRLTGAMVQSPSGDKKPIEIFRGDWESGEMYYVGDKVFYSGSTYLCVANPPRTGIAPTDTAYWQISAQKGRDGYSGSDGNDGRDGRIFSYAGEYSSDNTYIGDDKVAQVVKASDGVYYYTNERGEGTYPNPANNANRYYWTRYGANFESVATNLLLAENANIAGLIFHNEQLISQTGTLNGNPSTAYTNPNFKPNIVINGKTGFVDLSGQSRMRVPFKGFGSVNGDFTTTANLKEYFNILATPWKGNPKVYLPVGEEYNGIQCLVACGGGFTKTDTGVVEVRQVGGGSFFGMGLTGTIPRNITQINVSNNKLGIFVCLGYTWACLNYIELATFGSSYPTQ